MLATLVFVAAGSARLLRCHEGLPYLRMYGEPDVASHALQMLKTGDWNPRWFYYGSFGIYLQAGVDAVHFLWIRAQPPDSPEFVESLSDVVTRFDTRWRWTISHPSFYLWNRYFNALLGTACVALTYGIARCVTGRWTSLLAAGLLAGVTAHAKLSSYVNPDMPAATLALACVLASVLYVRRPRPRTLALALALAGLAASTKMNLALVVLVPAVALGITNWERRAGAWRWLLVPVVPVTAFFLGSPYALVEFPTFLEHVGHEVGHYMTSGQGELLTTEPGVPHALLQLGNLRDSMGWPVLLLACVGLPRMLRRSEGWVSLVFPIAYGACMTRTVVSQGYNFVVLYPFVAVAFACGVTTVHELLRDRAPAVAARAFAAALAVALTAHLAIALVDARAVGARRDTRSRAIAVINRLAGEHGWTRVGVVAELRMHRLDLNRLDVPFEPVSVWALSQETPSFDAILTAEEFTAHRNDKDDSAFKARRATALNDLLCDREVLARLPGAPFNVLLPNVDPGVLVVAGR